MSDLEEIARRLNNLDERLRRVETTDWPGVWFFIEEIVLAAPAANVTFSGIPGHFRTLALFTQSRTSVASTWDIVLWQANGDSGANYDRVYFRATAANTHASGGGRAQTAGYAAGGEGANSRANNWSPGLVFWPAYARADREKWSQTPISSYFGPPTVDGDVMLLNYASRWRNTNAITSLTLFPSAGANLLTGSRFTLYGIL